MLFSFFLLVEIVNIIVVNVIIIIIILGFPFPPSHHDALLPSCLFIPSPVFRHTKISGAFASVKENVLVKRNGVS